MVKTIKAAFKSFTLILFAAILFSLSITSASESETHSPITVQTKFLQRILKTTEKKPIAIINQNPEQKQIDKLFIEKVSKDERYKSIFKDQLQKEGKRIKENGGWGGGNSIRRSANDRPILLDFFTADSTFIDTSFNNPPLADTDKMQFMGTQTIYVEDLAAYTFAKNKLLEWQPANKGLIEAIITSLDNLTIRYVWRSVPLADAETYYLPNELIYKLRGGSLTPVVVYRENFGLLMSGPEWNQLGDLSQAGLLVHEALRRIQLTYKLTVSPQKLQALTAAIMLESPLSGIDLETTQFLDQKLLTEISRVSSKKLAPSFLKEAICKMKELKIQQSPLAMFCQTPACSIEVFCHNMKESDDDDLVIEMSQMKQQLCKDKKKIKKPTVDLSIQLGFISEVQLAEKINEVNSRIERNYNYYSSDSRRSTYATDSFFLTTDLPKIILSAYTPAQVQKIWTTWSEKNCSNSLPLTQQDVIEAAKFIFSTEDKVLQKLAIKNYISLSKNSPVYSNISLYELIRLENLAEDEVNNRRNRDVLGEELIDHHLLGKVKHPEFLNLVRSYKAMEQYFRQNSKIEKIDF